ncbi:MAG: DUF3179 domain-containing protein [Rhizobiaceae bacterium]|nr:DUF3179 domain-containing protein [Rhizobiaceae bacterium]
MTLHAAAKADIAKLSRQMFTVQGEEKREIVEQLVALKDKSLIPTFVLAMRWTRNNIYVGDALSELAGERLYDWHDAYVWQERNPQIVPHESFRGIKLWLLGNTDKKFLDLFMPPYGSRERMKIRLEEIAWGGALFDKIPSLDKPQMISAAWAAYLKPDDLVFGAEINGDARAYPLRIMGWHEMMNDVIGGVPVALAYCTLCGAGILFETQTEAASEPLVFGSTGLLYRSNKLMFDRQTKSVWNQFTGEPVIGPMVDRQGKLKIRPLTITTWERWKGRHPKSKVLSLNTGFFRNYDSGHVYREYFASPDLMFPAAVGDESELVRKDHVFGIRQIGAAKAWPLDAFENSRVINDQVGQTNVVLIGDAETRTVRAYERGEGEVFEINNTTLATKNTAWIMTEEFLISADGKSRRPRVAGHVSYWFAWDNYLGVKSELYSD